MKNEIEQNNTSESGDCVDLRSELVSMLNRYSRENVSNTPDLYSEIICGIV